MPNDRRQATAARSQAAQDEAGVVRELVEPLVTCRRCHEAIHAGKPTAQATT